MERSGVSKCGGGSLGHVSVVTGLTRQEMSEVVPSVTDLSTTHLCCHSFGEILCGSGMKSVGIECVEVQF